MKIAVRRIVSAHLSTLRDADSSQISPSDLALFFGVPLAAACAYAVVGWTFSADVLNALLTAFAIFAGLLLNLLLLVYTFSTQVNHPSALAKTRAELVKELHDNIAYSILLSVVLVAICIGAIAYIKMFDPPKVTGRWLSGTIVFLTLNFLLTLLMIVKRIYIMLNREIERPSVRRSA